MGLDANAGKSLAWVTNADNANFQNNIVISNGKELMYRGYGVVNQFDSHGYYIDIKYVEYLGLGLKVGVNCEGVIIFRRLGMNYSIVFEEYEKY